jgi:hypothetical protein
MKMTAKLRLRWWRKYCDPKVGTRACAQRYRDARRYGVTPVHACFFDDVCLLQTFALQCDFALFTDGRDNSNEKGLRTRWPRPRMRLRGSLGGTTITGRDVARKPSGSISDELVSYHSQACRSRRGNGLCGVLLGLRVVNASSCQPPQAC